MAAASTSSTPAPNAAAAAAGAPAWRSFAFFDDVAVNPPAPSIIASGGEKDALQSLHSIRPLAVVPPRVKLSAAGDEGEKAATSTSTSTSSSRALLAVYKTGALQLLESTTLLPAATEFNCLPASAPSGLVTHVEYDAASSRLVVLSEDGAGANANAFPLLRIWQLDVNLSQSASAWQPRLLGEARVQHGRKPFPIAQVAVAKQLAYLACSLGNGAVLLLRNLGSALDGAASVPASTSPAVSLPKFKVVFQPGAGAGASTSNATSADQEPVTALGFSSTSSITSLFIATLSRVMRYVVSGKGAGNPPATLDDIGCSLGCSLLLPASDDSHEAKLLIARDEALYIIGSNGREECFAYEGRKTALTHLPISNQIVILSPAESRTKISIFDLRGRYLSYTGSVPGDVLSVFTDGVAPSSSSAPSTTATVTGREDVLILTTSAAQRLRRLQERPLRSKLDALFRKGLFILASQVAKSHFELALRSSETSRDASARLNALLADIWIKYGDYLYEKGDYEGSMKMGYLKSVAAGAAARGSRGSRGGRGGRGERGASSQMGESYVIRKFLDAQRIPLLTLYLQELHKRGQANSDHTTLLLNCYTKLKDTEALDRFIRKSHVHSDDDGDDGSDDSGDDSDDEGIASDASSSSVSKRDRLPFDLPTAIKVCRAANYNSQAAYLARKYNMGDEYLRIKIEDTEKPLEALEWLRTREAAEVVHYLRQYAGALLAGGAEAETQTTDLLVELCSGAYRPRIVNSARALEQAARAARGGAGAGADAKANGKKQSSNANPSATARDPPPYDLNGNGNGGGGGADTPADATASSSPPSSYTPSARQFFPHFMRFPASLKRFLETVALARWGQAIDDGDVHGDDDELDLDANAVVATAASSTVVVEQRSIWNTILEMLLREDGEESRRRALRLLRQHRSLPYDVHHALILCEQAQLVEGVVYLYERLGMYEDVLRLWMDRSGDDDGDSNNSDSNGDERTASQRVLDALDRYAPHDPSLYSLVLTFLTSSPTLLARHRSSITSILLAISDLKLLSTLEIVQLLSRTPHVNVGLIKTFLDETVREEQSEMEADSRLIESYRAESSKKEREIEELTRQVDVSDVRVFQSSVCQACGGQLDLPAVHFMCKHSYHARCLGEDAADGRGGRSTTGGVGVDDADEEDDNTAVAAQSAPRNECPTCLRSYGVVAEIRRNNQAMATRQDVFLQELTEAEDPFQAVAGMFSRGVFSREALEA